MDDHGVSSESSSLTVTRLADWRVVFRHLDIAVPDGKEASYPLRADCPVCRRKQSLVVRNDTRFSGHWHTCSECGVAEDTISIAAMSWKTTPEIAIRRLMSAGALPVINPMKIEDYARSKPARRALVNAFWDEARKLPRNRADWNHLLRKCGIPHQVMNWEKRFGQFVGFSTAEAMTKLTQPSLEARSRCIRRAIFSRAIWSKMLIFPFEDMPGRIRGFLCLTTEQDDSPVWEYVAIPDRNRMDSVSTLHFDAGFGMARTVDINPDQKVVVFDDPLAAIRLQCRQLHEHPHPLPVMMSWDGQSYRSTDATGILGGREPVFWSNEPTMMNVARAYLTDGSVSTAKVENKLTPRMSVLSAVRGAVPFREALAKSTTRLSENDLRNELYKTGLSDTHLAALVRRATPEVDQLLGGKFEPTVVPRARLERYTTIVERGDTWVIEESGVVISNARVVIERDVYNTRLDQMVSVGFIGFRGARIPFQATQDVMAKNTERWISKVLASAQYGPLVVMPEWNKRLLAIAKKLREPSFESAPVGVGWDEQSGSFVFPQFTLFRNGDAVHSSRAWDKGAPAELLEIVEPDRNIIGQAMERNRGNRTFWAVFLALACDCISAVAGHRRVRTAIVGDGRESGLAAASLCGLSKIRTAIPADSKWSDHCRDHTWPAIADIAGLMDKQTHWILDHPEPAFTGLPNLQAQLIAIDDPTNIVRIPFRDDLDRLRSAAQVLLPSYLKDVLVRKLQLAGDGTTTERIVFDVGRWVRKLGYDTELLYAAAEQVEWHDRREPLDRFEEVMSILEDTRLGIAKRTSAGAFSISRNRLNGAMKNRGGRVLHPHRLEELFTATGGLISTTANMWLVQSSWWTGVLDKYGQAPETQEPKIVRDAVRRIPT